MYRLAKWCVSDVFDVAEQNVSLKKRHACTSQTAAFMQVYLTGI